MFLNAYAGSYFAILSASIILTWTLLPCGGLQGAFYNSLLVFCFFCTTFSIIWGKECLNPVRSSASPSRSCPDEPFVFIFCYCSNYWNASFCPGYLYSVLCGYRPRLTSSSAFHFLGWRWLRDAPWFIFCFWPMRRYNALAMLPPNIAWTSGTNFFRFDLFFVGENYRLFLACICRPLSLSFVGWTYFKIINLKWSINPILNEEVFGYFCKQLLSGFFLLFEGWQQMMSFMLFIPVGAILVYFLVFYFTFISLHDVVVFMDRTLLLEFLLVVVVVKIHFGFSHFAFLP